MGIRVVVSVLLVTLLLQATFSPASANGPGTALEQFIARNVTVDDDGFFVLSTAAQHNPVVRDLFEGINQEHRDAGADLRSEVASVRAHAAGHGAQSATKGPGFASPVRFWCAYIPKWLLLWFGWIMKLIAGIGAAIGSFSNAYLSGLRVGVIFSVLGVLATWSADQFINYVDRYYSGRWFCG